MKKTSANRLNNWFLLLVFLLFLAFTIPYIQIPRSIGEHTYTGELAEPASLTLSGARTYCLRKSGRSVEGDVSVTIGSFSKDCRLYSRATAYGCSGGWYDGPYSLDSGTFSTGQLGDFQQGGFSFRKDFSAVVVALYKDDTPYVLAVTDESSSLTPEEALASLRQARGK